jgi:hypothetical protein
MIKHLNIQVNMRLTPILALAVLAALVPPRVLGQAVPNMSGEWKLNIALSDYGPVPVPQMLTRTIQHNDPSLHITTHQKGAQGESTTELVYTTDGRECVNKIQGSEARGTAKWQGDHLVIDSVRKLPDTELKTVENWSVSNGGKTLTIGVRIALAQQDYNIKLVFDKQ